MNKSRSAKSHVDKSTKFDKTNPDENKHANPKFKYQASNIQIRKWTQIWTNIYLNIIKPNIIKNQYKEIQKYKIENKRLYIEKLNKGYQGKAIYYLFSFSNSRYERIRKLDMLKFTLGLFGAKNQHWTLYSRLKCLAHVVFFDSKASSWRRRHRRHCKWRHSEGRGMAALRRARDGGTPVAATPQVVALRAPCPARPWEGGLLAIEQ